MKKTPSVSRPRRVGELIQQELAPLVNRYAQDNALGLITLLEVDVSPDLTSAKIYFSLLNTSTSQDSEACEKSLREGSGHLRYELTQQIRRMRKVPRLHFIYDDTTKKAHALTRLIDETLAIDEAVKIPPAK